MTQVIALLAGLVGLAALHVTGLIQAWDLSHPFWHLRATLTGAAGAVVVGLAVFWITGRWPRLGTGLTILLVVALPVAAYVTWRAARVFIDSADFEPAAGQVWFMGYHATAALIVLTVAVLVYRAVKRSA